MLGSESQIYFLLIYCKFIPVLAHSNTPFFILNFYPLQSMLIIHFRLFKLLTKYNTIQIHTMIKCPLQDCGRKFDNEETMLEHVRRRHPTEYQAVRNQATKSLIQREHAQQTELNKLPKLAKIMSKEKKEIQKAVELPKRSGSKTRRLQSQNLSSIIQQSRLAISSKNSIANRRPSLTKKVSATDLRVEKLPPLEVEMRKTVQSSFIQKQKIEGQNNGSSAQQFYTTMPNFRSRVEPLVKSQSKGKIKIKKQSGGKNDRSSEGVLGQVKAEIASKNTISVVQEQKIKQEISIDKKKGFLRPSKKLQKKQSTQKSLTNRIESSNIAQVNFNQKILTIKSWQETTFICPRASTVQYLFLNSCNLANINLNCLESLIELSASHNRLKNMDFLQYNRNSNIKSVFLDHNLITQVYTPPKLKILTLSFNQIHQDDIQTICSILKKSPGIEELDFSFNNIRKAGNYKLKLLSVCQKLKKIDGLKVTKMDIEMMQQYIRLQSKQKGLIPLGSPSQDRPNTSQNENQDTEISLMMNKTINELEKQQRQYQKMISQTQDQLKIITKENQIISAQIEQLSKQTKDMQINWESSNLFQKLQKQCQFLQLLNVMQYADEDELGNMLRKKKVDLGISVQ